MEVDRGVYGLFCDGPIGMDHRMIMARTEVRRLALFGGEQRALVGATTTMPCLEVVGSGEQHHG